MLVPPTCIPLCVPCISRFSGRLGKSESQYAKHKKTPITQDGFSPAQKANSLSIETLCDESVGGGKVDANHSLIGPGRAL